MGLDITVHPIARRLEEHACVEYSDACYEAGHVHAYGFAGFEQSLRGLEPLAPDPRHENMVTAGWYDVSGAQSWTFRAGSYSGYNRFREALCHAALGVTPQQIWNAVDDYRDKLFFELIHFADNEGTIGPDAAADLADDFEIHRDRIQPQLEGWFGSSYDEWAKAFRDAAGTGLVEFG